MPTDLAASDIHKDLLLRLSDLNNWDKHRRIAFALFAPKNVSEGLENGRLDVVNRPGVLDDLYGIDWLGRGDRPEPICIDDPAVLAHIEAQVRYPAYDFHFSWWPPSVGDEIGRYIRHTGEGQVPDITVEASLQLVIFEPRLFSPFSIEPTPADHLLARIIDEVLYVINLVRELSM